MEKEIWKDVPGYEGLYQVSSFGRVRSLDRMVWGGKAYYFKEGQIQKLQNNGNGYMYKQLKHEGTGKNFYIHRLVMMTFVGDRPKNMVICHIDGDKTNNRLDNLRYDTYSENNIDQFRHSDKRGKLSNSDVLKVREMCREGYQTKEISEFFNVGKWVVQNIKNGTNYSWLNDDGTIDESKTQIKYEN